MMVENDPKGSVARGYRPGTPPQLAEPWDLGCLSSCRSLVSNIEDMSRFLSLQPGAGKSGVTPVSGPSLAEIQRPQRILDGWRSAAGLGWIIDLTEDLGEVVRHNGGMAGYTSHMSLSLENGIGVVVLSNHGYDIDAAPIHKLGETLLRQSIPFCGRVEAPLEELADFLPGTFREEPGDDLLSAFTPKFLQKIPPDAIRAAFSEEATKPGRCLRVASVDRLEDAWHGRIALAFEDESQLVCVVRLSRQYPHRLTYIRLD